MARFIAPVLLLVMALAGPGEALAQQVLRIAAVVNDDVISIYDLQTRVEMVVKTSGLADTPAVRRRIAPQVLRALVDEKLQLQEAKRRSVRVREIEITRALRTIAERNKVPPDAFEAYLERNGIPRQALVDQVRANIAWAKLIGRRLRPRVTIGEDEVDETLARIKERRNLLQFRLAEILIDVPRPDDETEMRGAAERLVAEVKGGARFGALARQFSRSATAAVGGDLGWVYEDELGPEMLAMVSDARKGALIGPKRTSAGYQIVLLRDRRRAGEASPDKITLTLKQILLPPGNGGAADGRLATVQGAVRSCADIAAVAKRVGSAAPPDLGVFKLSDLSGSVREAVEGLAVDVLSPPIATPAGQLLLMVCKRDAPPVTLPSRQEIVDRLTSQRLARLERRYLRDLRLAAIVDVRV
jgi:peptidyl-prolyl cis-trans isomerase SurA